MKNNHNLQRFSWTRIESLKNVGMIAQTDKPFINYEPQKLIRHDKAILAAFFTRTLNLLSLPQNVSINSVPFLI